VVGAVGCWLNLAVEMGVGEGKGEGGNSRGCQRQNEVGQDGPGPEEAL
jgi:hypothetical protein